MLAALRKTLFGLIGSMVVLVPQACGAAEPKFKEPPPPDPSRFVISGRIVDRRGEAVKDCTVRLWEPKGKVSLETRCKPSGEFSIPHNESGALTLEVLPPEASGYAQSLVEKLPGNESRKLIVRLRPGHLVTGRILDCDGKRGLKGLIIKVEPLDKGEDGQAHLHGSGGCETLKKGVFSFRLTEGKKKMLIINELYSSLPPVSAKEFQVSGDTHLGAIVLSAAHKD